MSWLSNFNNRVEITLNTPYGSTDLSHFHVGIHLSNSAGTGNEDLSYIFNEIGSSWQKIAVTKSDGTTQLYVEKERWDSANNEGMLWVSDSTWTLPSNSTTSIYLYYDSGASDNTSYVGSVGNRTEVWDSSIMGRWDMAQDPSTSTLYDSTSNNNDGSVQGSMTSDDLVSGDAGGAWVGDGGDDTVAFGDTMEPANTTVIFHVNPHDVSVYNDFYGDEPSGSGTGRSFLINNDGTVSYGAAFGGSWSKYTTSFTISSGTYSTVSASYDGSTLSIFKNASTIETFSQSGNLPNNSYAMHIMSNIARHPFDGYFDDAIIYDTRKSDGWIQTMHDVYTDSFCTFGTNEQAVADVLVQGMSFGANV